MANAKESEMSPFRFQFEYKFHPVGQGLFATGWLGHEPDSSPCFRWVYDCGTLSGEKLLEAAIGNLEAEAVHVGKGKPIINLVTIWQKLGVRS